MNVTEADLAIAAALYPILVNCARQNPVRILTYGALLDEAKKKAPIGHAIEKAIPVSLGRRLDVVRMFLDEQNLPNLTSLIVNAGTGEVGSAFGANPEHVRAQVAEFNWNTVAEDFNLHIDVLRKDIESRSRLKLSREAAKRKMSDYFIANRSVLPKEIAAKREFIIELLCDGVPVDQAFSEAASRTDEGLAPSS